MPGRSPVRFLLVAATTLATALSTAVGVSSAADAAAGRPTIGALSPASGPVGGGARVTITGSNFSNVRSVTFGGTASTQRTVARDGRSMVVTAPSHAAGTVTIVVRTGGGSATKTGAYDYAADWQITRQQAQQAIPPVDSPVALSCPGTNNCYGIDKYGNYIFGGHRDAIWINHGPPSGTSTTQDKAGCLYSGVCAGLSCPAIGFCVSVDDQGRPLVMTDRQWHAYPAILPNDDGFRDTPHVTCSSTQFCMIMDDASDYSTWDGTSWSAPKNLDGQTITEPPMADSEPYDHDLSCAGNACMMVDQDGVAYKFSNGTWDKHDAVHLQGFTEWQHELSALSCANVSTTATRLLCVVQLVTGSGTVKLVRYSDGQWHPGDAESFPNHPTFGGVSCRSDGHCLAVLANGAGYEYGDSSTRRDAHGWAGPFHVTDAAKIGPVFAVSCQSLPCTATLAHGFVAFFSVSQHAWSDRTDAVIPPAQGIGKISCALDANDATYCLAASVGQFVTVYENGSWQEPTYGAFTGGQAADVSCVDGARFCMYIQNATHGGYVVNKYTRWQNGDYHNHSMITGKYAAISCWSTKGCYAASAANLVEWDGKSWSKKVDLKARKLSIADLSCVTGNSSCLAVTRDGHSFRVDGSSVSKSASLHLPAGTHVVSASCSLARQCIAVSGAGYVYALANAIWTPEGSVKDPDAVGSPPPDPLLDVSCAPGTSPTACMAMSPAENSVRWDGALHLLPQTSGSAVSCPSAAGCYVGDPLGDVTPFTS